MKKNTLAGLLAMAVIITSCDKMEDFGDKFSGGELQQEPMSVLAITQIPTKGIVTGTTFPTTRSMNVSADLNSDTGGSGNYFTNVTFSYGSSVWAPTATYYWPLSGTMELMAYSAGSASVTPTWTNATKVVLTCSDCTADDVLVGGLTGAKSSNKSIAFKHAFTQVKCTAKSNVASVIKIKSVKVTAYKSGTVTCSKTAGSSAVTFSTATSGSTSDVAFFSGSQDLTTSAAAVGNPILLPAQTPSKITVTYTITNNGTESQTMSTSATVTTACAEGKAYTYAVSMSLTGINVTASLTDWTDGGSSSVTL